MLSSTARGVPRFSMTSERCSSSTCRSRLPRFVRARRAETTMLSFFCVLGIELTHQLDYTNCTVPRATIFELSESSRINCLLLLEHCDFPIGKGEGELIGDTLFFPDRQRAILALFFSLIDHLH